MQVNKSKKIISFYANICNYFLRSIIVNKILYRNISIIHGDFLIAS